MFNSTLVRKTGPIITQNTLMVSTTKQLDRGTSTRKIVLVNYHEQQRQVLCEGVLEISPMDTIVRVRSCAY